MEDPSFRFKRGRYYAVSLHVRVNGTAGSADGFTRLYVDGRKIESREKVWFRGKGGDATMINRLLFSTFHGAILDTNC